MVQVHDATVNRCRGRSGLLFLECPVVGGEVPARGLVFRGEAGLDSLPFLVQGAGPVVACCGGECVRGERLVGRRCDRGLVVSP